MQNKNRETGYLSFDIETDGPSVILNSMISLGIVLFDNAGKIIDEFYVNIEEKIGSSPNEDTMINFWSKYPKQYEDCHKNQKSPSDAMTLVANFYTKWSNVYRLIWIAMPICFDWMFLKTYYMSFAPKGSIDIGFKGTCISTIRDYAIKNKQIKDKEYDELIKNIPDGGHNALDDARVQGLLFFVLNDYLKAKNKN